MTYPNGEYLIPGCQGSYSMPDDIIISRRDDMTNRAWGDECGVVADYLGIHISAHWGLHASEYIAKVIENPHGGLLGKRMAYWLTTNLVSGALVAVLYISELHVKTIELDGFTPNYLAWQEVDKANPPIIDEVERQEAWAEAAKMLLNQWKAKHARRLSPL